MTGHWLHKICDNRAKIVRALASNVDKDGITILFLLSIKILGHNNNKINCFSLTVIMEINGKILQNKFKEGIPFSYLELIMILKITSILRWGEV